MTRRLASIALLLLAWAAGSGSVHAAESRIPAEEPRLVQVVLPEGMTANTLIEAGLDVVGVRGQFVRIFEWSRDQGTLQRLGLTSEVIDATPGRTAARLAAEGRGRLGAESRRGGARLQSPPPFGSGSMGGYWTAAEIRMKLDDLVAYDVNDVVADQIDSVGTTREGRTIWGLKLGKTVVGPDPRPKSYLISLMHAREPQGMQALFYFVDDLLAGYGTDPYKTYLLDQRVIYIVPLANPDGYARNEATYTGSGGTAFGFWRKNGRDNDGDTVLETGEGVDLNRNYDYQWGCCGGSSPSPSSEIYRGPSPASEPETQALKTLVQQLQPRTGISYHTHGDYMLHPWGYGAIQTLDHPSFVEWTDEMTRDNGCIGGLAPLILYTVDGEFNDWCYGDTLSKPRVFSWTPEVGDDNDGFWPPPGRILPLAQEHLRTGYTVVSIAGPWVQSEGFDIAEGSMRIGNLTHISVRARNLGLGTAGPGLQGTLVPLDAGVTVLSAFAGYPTLGHRQTGSPSAPFQVAVHDTVTPGRLLRFEVDFTASDGLFSRDTVAIPAGVPTVVAFDDASSGLTKWSVGTPWGIRTNDPTHPSRYFADSPAGVYPDGSSATLRFLATLPLNAGVHAYAFFENRWVFEKDWDAMYFEVSTNGTTWTPIPTTGTTPGSGVVGGGQTLNAPLYAGSRRLWQPERVDLSAYTGPSSPPLRIRFRLASDGATSFDGFDFDSLRIVIYDPSAQPAPVAVGEGAAPRAIELAASPNPARGPLRFDFALPRDGHARLEVLDIQGRRVATLASGEMRASRYVHGWDGRDDDGRPVGAGVYIARLATPQGSVARRFAIAR